MPRNYGEHCLGCPYSRIGKNASDKPLSMENNSSDVLLIFQAPGEMEWIKKKPLCSENDQSAAARIRNSLKRIGKTRQEFNITNAIQCYPGRSARGRDNKPINRAQKKCANWLREDIDLSAFRKIIVFGSSARKAVNSLGFTNDHRFVFLRHPSGGLSNIDLDSALSM